MRKTLLMAALAGAIAAPALAQAQTSTYSADGAYYLGLDAMKWTFSADGSDFDTSAVGGRFRAGVDITPYLAVEAHVGTGGSDDDGDVDAKLDYLAGAYVRGTVPLASDFRLYGLAGYSEVSLDITNDRLSDGYTAKDDGFSYGAGVEVDLMEYANLYVEGVRYIDREEDFEVIGGGVRYVF